MRNCSFLVLFWCPAFVIVALGACHKSLDSGPYPPSRKLIMAVEYYPLTGSASSVIWENGKTNPLVPPGDISCLALSGKDYYVGGVYGRSSNSLAAYWKNGSLVTVTDTFNAAVQGILVDGPDVYLAGQYADLSKPDDSAQPAAVYWKNGLMTRLNGHVPGSAVKLALSGGDLYISGSGLVNGQLSGLLWKNGILMSTQKYPLQDFAVAGEDVYGLGQLDSVTWAVFRNGTPMKVPDMALGRSILLNGNDVYVSGIHGHDITGQAGIWKNNVLETLPSGVYNSDALGGIVIDGKDVYVAGYDGGHPCYWKNAVRYDLDTLNTGAIYGIGIISD